MATRKSVVLSGTDNNSLFERRFMFAERHTVPTQLMLPVSSTETALGMRPSSSAPTTPQVSAAPTVHDRAMPSTDYTLFLRSFDSNQRLTEQGSMFVQSQMEKYKQLHEAPTGRFHPVLVQPGANMAFNPLEGMLDRHGEQTRYNTKKNEHTLESMAMRQYNSSYTPQSMAAGMAQMMQYSTPVIPAASAPLTTSAAPASLPVVKKPKKKKHHSNR